MKLQVFNSKPFLLILALRTYKCNLEDCSLYKEEVKAAINVKSTLKAGHNSQIHALP